MPEPSLSASHPSLAVQILLVALTGVAAFAFFSLNNGFPLGLQLNEQTKVDEIITGKYYFLHPLFLPRMTRFLIGLLGFSEPFDVVRVGRTLSAVMATVAVLCLYLLAGKRVGMRLAALTALAMAATPMLAVHAHYLKEDACLFGFCALAVVAGEALFRRINIFTILLTGLLIGLATATKLVGAFLLPVLIIAAPLCRRERRGRLLLALIPVALIAIIVLAAVNNPMLADPVTARADIRYSFAAATLGNNRMCCVYHPGANYLLDVVQPGMGWPLFIFLGTGFSFALINWRRAPALDRLMLVYAAVYYGLIELSPYRDWPDLSRTPIPLLLPLFYFAGAFLQDAGTWLVARQPDRGGKATLTALYGAFLLAAAIPAYDALRLVSDLADDTRTRLAHMAGGKTLTAFFEDQTLPFHQPDDGVRTVEDNDFRQFLGTPARYLVVSSFIYDKFAFAMRHKDKDVPLVRRTWNSFEGLFVYPYCAIRPHWHTYAYSNPTLYVFDIDTIRQGREAVPEAQGRPCDEKFFAG